MISTLLRHSQRKHYYQYLIMHRLTPFSSFQGFDPKVDYYKVLGAQPTESIQEIKMKYYKLALKLHPDKT